MELHSRWCVLCVSMWLCVCVCVCLWLEVITSTPVRPSLLAFRGAFLSPRIESINIDVSALDVRRCISMTAICLSGALFEEVWAKGSEWNVHSIIGCLIGCSWGAASWGAYVKWCSQANIPNCDWKCGARCQLKVLLVAEFRLYCGGCAIKYIPRAYIEITWAKTSINQLPTNAAYVNASQLIWKRRKCYIYIVISWASWNRINIAIIY